jgi:plastocyanin
MAPRAILPLGLAISAALVGGCGERREPGGTVRTSPVPVAAPAATTATAVATIDVSLVDYRLAPPSPRVARHGVIAFVATNDGQTRHALAVDGPTGEVRTVALRPGERTTITLRLARGTYRWYCPIADHERRGMVGLVRVAE